MRSFTVKKNVPEEALSAVTEASSLRVWSVWSAGPSRIEVEQKQDLLETCRVFRALEQSSRSECRAKCSRLRRSRKDQRPASNPR